MSSRAEALPPESLGTEWVRIWAFAARNLIMARRNVFFVFELTFWPGVAMLSHGLLTRFLALTPEMTAFILVGTVALLATTLGPIELLLLRWKEGLVLCGISAGGWIYLIKNIL